MTESNNTPMGASITELRNSIVALARCLRQSSGATSESWTELMVLGAIARRGGQATPSDICRELGLRSSNAAQLLKHLDDGGLVRRSADPGDKRKVRLALTEAGAMLVRDTRAQRDGWLLTAMQERLSASEQAQLVAAGKLMLRLAASAQRAPDPEAVSPT